VVEAGATTLRRGVMGVVVGVCTSRTLPAERRAVGVVRFAAGRIAVAGDTCAEIDTSGFEDPVSVDAGGPAWARRARPGSLRIAEFVTVLWAVAVAAADRRTTG
jgi:hypothetical protein